MDDSLERYLSSLEENTFAIVMDSTVEKTTLGGIMTLRAEIELIAKHCQLKKAVLYLKNPDNFETGTVNFITEIMSASACDIQVRNYPGANGLSAIAYPDVLQDLLRSAKYYSTLRLTSLWRHTGLTPSLEWKAEYDLSQIIKRFEIPTKFACLHLKTSGIPGEGIASEDEWLPVIEEINKVWNQPILLLGQDKYFSYFKQERKFIKLSERGMPIVEQLRLIQGGAFFIGNASGVASGAMYGSTPYLIFKDENYHGDQMIQELGSKKTFPWANTNQLILRKRPDAIDFKVFQNSLS